MNTSNNTSRRNLKTRTLLADVIKYHDTEMDLSQNERCMLLGLMVAYEHFGCPLKGTDIGMTGLERYTGMSAKTNSKALHALVDKGFIEIKLGSKQRKEVTNIKFKDRYLFSPRQQDPQPVNDTKEKDTEQEEIDWSYT